MKKLILFSALLLLLLPLWGMHREAFLAGPVVAIADATLVNGHEGSEISGVTGVAATDVFTKTAHGLVNGDLVILRTLTGGVGLKTDHPYFIIDKADNTFKFSETYGGSSIDFSTNLTDGSVFQVDFYSTEVWMSRFEGKKEPVALFEVRFDRDTETGTAASLDLYFEVSIDGGTTWGTAPLFVIEVPTNTAADTGGVVIYHGMYNLYGVTDIRLAKIDNTDAVTDLFDINVTISF